MKLSQIILIHKKVPHLNQLNCRPITSINSNLKILDAIINQKILTTLEISEF